MKKTLSVTMGVLLSIGGLSSANAIMLTFVDNATPAAFSANPDTFGASNISAMSAGSEFRMLDTAGTVAGGSPGARDVYFGGETWTFDGAGFMTGTGGTPTNAGGLTTGSAPGLGSSAAPTGGTNPTTQQHTNFSFAVFSFLAPTTTSLTGTAYGPATLSLTGATSGTISVLFPVLELQWDNAWFPLGAAQTGTDTSGVLFSGAYTCATLTCSFRMQAQETFNGIVSGNPGAGDLPDEDPVEAGFGVGWTAQWDVVGTFDATVVPLPATAWLFGSGLLGLIGLARRKKAA